LEKSMWMILVNLQRLATDSWVKGRPTLPAQGEGLRGGSAA
jgi:hypothetical protein